MLAKRTVEVFSATSQEPQHVPVTPQMVHMVKNKHNFESHSKGERPLPCENSALGAVVRLSGTVYPKRRIC